MNRIFQSIIQNTNRHNVLLQRTTNNHIVKTTTTTAGCYSTFYKQSSWSSTSKYYSTSSSSSSSSSKNNNNTTTATTTKVKPEIPKGTGDKYLDMYGGEIPKYEGDTGKKEGPSVSPLSKVEFCKSLLMMRKSGTMSSVNMLAKMESENSSPVYGSIVPYAVLGDGSDKGDVVVVVSLKKDDPHVGHFKHFGKVSLVVYPLTPRNRPPAQYGLSRVNFSGRVKRLVDDSDECKLAKQKYLERHPGGKSMLNSSTHDIYTITMSDLYHYERQGTSRIDLEKFKQATPDAVCVESREIIETINDKHIDAISVICEQYGDVPIDESFVYFVDSAGFNTIAKRKGIDEWFDIRVPFDRPFESPAEAKTGLLETINDIKDKHLIK
ncbi:hypothetical protein DFA_04458 [Cavenderia fasciculata]|uniref:DUF2470 domain-containing protein n=1 Tax=Cavenderia fasciculata TaxID=261658 RepID=F4PPM7_CACFS|nr:uncharacterized protein DFA_04458 [Cavenderia fasciculata]EGG22340.1 hypothetical protein DFA_04458 [Cavenderia fasciculata]|eukprot:XP_004360191.1 hypothetical protein DFA_04458 [Cavenderia fasciculata]